MWVSTKTWTYFRKVARQKLFSIDVEHRKWCFKFSSFEENREVISGGPLYRAYENAVCNSYRVSHTVCVLIAVVVMAMINGCCNQPIANIAAMVLIISIYFWYPFFFQKENIQIREWSNQTFGLLINLYLSVSFEFAKCLNQPVYGWYPQYEKVTQKSCDKLTTFFLVDRKQI